MTQNNFPTKTLPDTSAPLVHRICEFYKLIYLLSPKIPKKDRFGIYLEIENTCLTLIDLLIGASLETKFNKLSVLSTTRIKVETLKVLVRISHEIKIINIKKYIQLESELQTISRMINGWIKYLRSLTDNPRISRGLS